ncbi:MAG: HAD family phosphatase [Flavobacteriales bacterium]|nr:HAD family phosphatase [Flavobacteriales bacterium]
MKIIHPEPINAIIFDLGNVIIDLDIEATTIAFQNIYGLDYEENMAKLEAKQVFAKYETGHISTQTFLNELSAFDDAISFDEIKNAWNAMLLDIPEENYKILLNVKKSYKTFCLSNTNKLHIDFIYKQLKIDKGISNLDNYFEKVYLSHEMGKRKPNVDIFEELIKNHQLDPNTTVFIDDTADHLEGAKQAGLHTIHMTEELSLSSLFK